MPIYVQHEVLGRIPDVFNAEAIWQAPGLALFARRPLLRDLLERCPREHRGRAATRCFSHVTLMLPQEEVDDDYHLTRGAKARDLAQTLTALHQKDFGDLLGSDQVRYDVVGTDALAPGEIEVKFGHAVYLPAADEKILYNVSVSRDSAIWTPVCPIYPDQRLALIGAQGSAATCAAPGWPFGPDGAILIINDGPDTPPTVQMRPKDSYDCRYDPRGGYYTIKSTRGGIDELGGSPRLLLKITRTGAAAAARPAEGPATRPAVWQTRQNEAADVLSERPMNGTVGAMSDTPAGQHDEAARLAQQRAAASAQNGSAGYAHGAAQNIAHDVVQHNAQDIALRRAQTVAAPDQRGGIQINSSHSAASAMIATNSADAAALSAARTQRGAGTNISTRANTNSDQTAIPLGHKPVNQPGESDATYAPIAQQRVSLVALALPRLSRYRDTGAHALELPFNRALTIADAQQAGAAGERVISIVVNAADELYACTAAGRQRIQVPASFAPVDARAIRLLPAPDAMADRYCATLCLAQPLSVGVASGARFIFGRNSAMLAALRVLDSPRFLQRGAGSDNAGASADRIGLSRNAFSFEAGAQGYKIGRLTSTQALYHLDERMQFVACIAAASNEAPYLLPAGHHLVAGHYVLRFDA